MSGKDVGAIDRETIVEQFDEEQADHTEWWSEEMNRVREVRDEIMAAAQERDDVQLMQSGTSTSRDGRHEATFKLRVAGEPWDGGSDD